MFAPAKISYVIVQVAVVFGINCGSNAGQKLVIVLVKVLGLHYESN